MNADWKTRGGSVKIPVPGLSSLSGLDSCRSKAVGLPVGRLDCSVRRGRLLRDASAGKTLSWRNEMRSSVLLSFLFLIFIAVPAPAQNIWPVSFGYWWNCPDRHMPDLLGADHSIAHAQGLANLCDEELRGAMQNRNQAMSQQELSRYNSPSMLPPIYPDSASSDSTKSPSTSDKPSSSAPASAPPPSPSGSPFPSVPPSEAAPGPATKPVQSGGGSSAPRSSAPSPLPSAAAPAAALGRDSRPAESTPER